MTGINKNIVSIYISIYIISILISAIWFDRIQGWLIVSAAALLRWTRFSEIFLLFMYERLSAAPCTMGRYCTPKPPPQCCWLIWQSGDVQHVCSETDAHVRGHFKYEYTHTHTFSDEQVDESLRARTSVLQTDTRRTAGGWVGRCHVLLNTHTYIYLYMYCTYTHTGGF